MMTMIINEEELAQTHMLFDRAVFGSLSLHIVRWQKQLFINIKGMKDKNVQLSFIQTASNRSNS